MKPIIKIQNNGSTWRVIIDGTNATKPIQLPTPYEWKKQQLGLTEPTDEKRQTLLQRYGWAGIERPEFMNDKEEAVSIEFDSLCHAGATTAKELNWVNEDHSIGYFWSTREKLLAAFTQQELNTLCAQSGDEYKGQEGGALPKAKELAQDKFDNLENLQDFVDYKNKRVSPQNLEGCTVAGTICAEKPDDNGQHTNAQNGFLGSGYKEARAAQNLAMSGL
tara:strand:+ start:1572 stop:2231 length:660 start_codon:yes stop_codon:yes gene_type:complete